MANDFKEKIEKFKEFMDLWAKYEESQQERKSLWEVYKNNEDILLDSGRSIGGLILSMIPIVGQVEDAVDAIMDEYSAITKDEIFKNQEKYYVDLYKYIGDKFTELNKGISTSKNTDEEIKKEMDKTFKFYSLDADAAFLNIDDAARFYQYLVLNPSDNPDKKINPAESLYSILKWKELFSKNYIDTRTSSEETKSKSFVRILLDRAKESELEKKEMVYLLNKMGVPYKYETYGFKKGNKDIFSEETSFNQTDARIDQNYEYYDENSILAILSDAGSLINAGYKLTDSDYLDPSSMIKNLLIDDDFLSNMGGGGDFNIPIKYGIEIEGIEQFANMREEAEKTSRAYEESCDTINNFSSEMMNQFLKLNEERRAAFSIDMPLLPLNMMGIGGIPFQNISTSVEDADKNVVAFSNTLSDIAGIAGQIGGAFMSVDEEIGKAISSAGTLTEGVAGIFKAFEGDKVNGLGLMSGIQGGFAGLQGLFGGEAGSDSSQLLGGMGGVGAGVAGLLTGRAFGSFQFRLANT